MYYAIFTKYSWWRGVTQDDRVVFYIREAESDEDILKQLDPDSSQKLTVHNLEDNDFLKANFNVDKVIDQLDPDSSQKLTVHILEDNDFLKANFNVDKVIAQIG